MNTSRMFSQLTLSIQGGSCHCVEIGASLRLLGRNASRWSLGTDRESRKPKADIVQSLKVPMRGQNDSEDKRLSGKERMRQMDIKKYEFGKKWLAKMMGEDIEDFSEEKVKESLNYLLPSHLFARDARPILKHPLEVYGQAKELGIDEDGRPLNAGFYTTQPRFHEVLFEIHQKKEILADAEKSQKPIMQSSNTEIRRWMSKEELEQKFQEKIKEEQYEVLMHRLKKIQDHPHAELVADFISKFQLPLTAEKKEKIILEIDEEGYVTAMGYRKTAVAEVKMKRGTGKVYINGKEIYDYFPWIPYRQQLMFPFLVTDSFGKFDVDASVIAGGLAGQAGAIRLGISRALPSFNESYYDLLEEAGLLTRDTRQLERMKPGQKGARKKFQWVKR